MTITIKEAAERCLEPLKAAGRWNTARSYDLAIRHFQEYLKGLDPQILPEMPVSELVPDHFVDFIYWCLTVKKYKPKTANVYVFGTKHLLDWLVTRDLIEFGYKHSTQYVHALVTIRSKSNRKLPRIPNDDEIRKILETTYSGMGLPDLYKLRNVAIILFLLRTGCRNSELCHLDIHDIDLIERSAFIEAGKGNVDREVYFTQETADALKAYWDARGHCGPDDPAFARLDRGAGKKIKRIGPAGVRYVVNEIEEASGLHGIVTPHKFRHRFATDALSATNDIKLVADLLGHSDPGITSKVYARYSNKQRSDRYRSIYDEK